MKYRHFENIIKTLLLKLGQRKAFCDHQQSSEGNLTFRRLKCDTGRFKCVCDRSNIQITIHHVVFSVSVSKKTIF